MKIKLLVPRTGPLGAQNIGDEIEVSADEAERMIGKEQAEIIRAKKPERTAKRAKVEKAVK